MQLSVECFGGLRIRLGGAEQKFSRRKAKALVGYLAVTGHPTPRAVLANLLWTEIPEDRARANLRVAMTDAGNVLGDLLLTEGDQVQLRPGALSGVDAISLEAAAADGRWDEVVDLYRGPFLDGFFLDRALAFDEWASGSRERFERTAMLAFQERASRYLDVGDAASAAATLSRLAALAPLHEHPRRQLMVLLAESGNVDAALDEYRRLREGLATELGSDPDPETVELAERIAGHRSYVPVPDRLAVPDATPLIGRDLEIRVLEKALAGESYRLVTLVGPGGVGKTRLVRELVRRLQRAGRPGSIFVDLAGITAAPEIPGAVARALHLPLLGLRDPVEEIVAALGDAEVLLVLDNLEHLLPGGARFVATLLGRCPGLAVVVTSRVRLGLGAERVLRLKPLGLPEPDAGDDDLLASPALALFVVRAEADGTVVPPASLHDAAELCRRLDGLPLAIELAAIQLRYFTPGEVLASLDRSLDDLHDPGFDRPDRHRTLYDSVQWSYRMLDDPSRRLLRYLSVFRGGAALDILRSGLVPGVIADHRPLTALVDAALLDRHQATGVTRFAMMESTRAFALRELEEHGEHTDAAARHATASLELTERADAGLRGPEQIHWLERFDAEADNIAAALRYARRHDVGTALRLVNALSLFSHIRGHLHEGITRIEEVLALDGPGAPSEEERARALLNLALLSIRRSDRSLDAALYTEAETSMASLGDEVGLAMLRHAHVGRQLHLGLTEPGAVAEIVETLTRAQVVLEAQGALWESARVMYTLSAVLFVLPDVPAALDMSRRSYARFEELGDRRGTGCALQVLGAATRQLGERASGRQMLRRAVENLMAVGDYVETVNALHAFGGSLVLVGDDPVEGARLLGAGARLGHNAGLAYPRSFQAVIDRRAVEVRATIGDDVWQRAWDDGWRLGLDVPLVG